MGYAEESRRRNKPIFYKHIEKVELSHVIEKEARERLADKIHASGGRPVFKGKDMR